ncbi:hypothetical protein [Bradyrhizobium sp. AUGA SZCCT0182]|uniref:hypothetical protein n=1 Tax=Bradyrhizobium sp. AUGA SZCCT0182 TaxID=2807667 RepID=UPI001BAA8DFB|nr:hypothetical protein [Bradyrhizobium sp. AUGA SZCCT0182]MBR1237984.1 hypothetical protein [Bradyrhizobium sp. AUGA SZCCT0182]
MQTAIDRVMKTYGMMVNLTSEQERQARDEVARFLESKRFDERTLAVEGLKYLRARSSRRRERI